MHTTGAIAFGVVCGVLVSALYILAQLMRYVTEDMDGFRKWLDKAEGSV